MNRPQVPNLKLLFEPRSVAIIGASKDELKVGGMFINSMLRDGYAGKIYPVNRKESDIMGLACYPGLSAIPGDVDLAILAIPAQTIVTAMEECALKQVKFAIVHSVGFSEMGNEGRELEKKMVQIARKGNVRIIGPNCMGIFTSRGKLNTVIPYAKLPLDPGNMAFVGQSGWVSEIMLRLGSMRGLRFSGVISIGNQSDLTLEDLIEYWGRDPDTKVIAAYIEGSKDSYRLTEIAREICPQKPLIIWKGGSSEMGAKSAASHTGSITGSYQVFQAMCKQTGIIPAYGMEEVIDLAVGFSSPVLPSGNRLGLLIEAGGGAVASSDAGAREGLIIPELSQNSQNRLAEYLKDRVPPSANRKNPVDLVWVSPADPYGVFTDCLEIVLPEVDVCLTISYALYKDEKFRLQLTEIRDRLNKPIVLIPGNPADQMDGMSMATRNGLPSYVMPENAIRSISAMVKRGEYLKNLQGKSP